MSRFFRGDESSDSESDYSSSSSGSEFSDEEMQKPSQQASGAGASRFARAAFDSDDSDDDVKRVVKSAKDKQLDEVIELSKAILEAMRADEWNSVSNDFEKVNKVVPKLIKSLKGESLPRTYIRCLASLEDAVEANRDKSELKKLNANDARALNQLKQRVRKHNKTFAKQIAEYRKNPTASDNEAEADAGAEADSEDDQAVPASPARAASPVPTAAKKAKQPAAASDSESDDSYWGSDSEDEASSSESEDDGRVGYARWLKKMPAKKEDESAKMTKKEKAQKKVQAAQAAQAAAAADEDEDDGFTTVGKGGKAAQGPSYSSENLHKHLRAVIEARGRKNTDKQESIRILVSLLGVAANAVQEVKVLMALISALFDNAVSSAGYMPIDTWTMAKTRLNELLSTLEANPQVTISETAEVTDGESDVSYSGEPISLRGSVIAFIDRLDDEFTKSLQNIDPHTTDYVDRMRDIVPLYTVIVRAQLYFERAGLKDSLSRAVLRRLEHIYYRTDQVNLHVEAAVADIAGRDKSSVVPASTDGDMEAIIHRLCTHLYLHADPLLRTRAMLMHIFNHALHKRYYVARDLLLMSHLQENVHQADVNTQVLYNRALAQLGLAAFRLGKIQESFQHTLELISSGRQRELLAQGLSQQRVQQLSPEQEQLQRQRQLPFHININLELLECVFLTASMLLEIPYMASASTNPEARRNAISRVFRRMLDFNERQVFLGPPENTRDHIMAASKALAAGDWEAARDYIKGIKIWSLLPESEEIKEMLASKIQVEALRTYLFTYSTQFESVGLGDLATMFDLPRQKVYSLLARMVYHEEVAASLDEVSGVLTFNRSNFEASSRLQQTALALSTKATAFADINERMFELKINGGQAPGDRQQGGAEQSSGAQRDRDSRQGQQRGGGNRGDGQRGSSHQKQNQNKGGNRGNNRRNNGQRKGGNRK
ncbi:Translation initiation factor 3 subunit c [Dipsacomyces acuminosporus]|nr:Translation initiation factor 3 subunit c [Dipsacomyces acuminosporus]